MLLDDPSYLASVLHDAMKSEIKVVTWNVNSVNARLSRICAFLTAHKPDVVCLQEIKCRYQDFPSAELLNSGYTVELHGQPTYNGVAILTRDPAQQVVTGLDEEARVIAATAYGVRWVNVYVPNGQRVGSPKYQYKRQWLVHLEDFLQREASLVGEFVLMGDFNVILNDHDTAHPAKWEGSVLCDPDTRSALGAIMERFGLEDVLRRFAPGPGIYTWWDYRTRAFQWNDGVRIDHILMTPGLAARAVNAWVDVEERGRERPSDHAPVLARLLVP